MFLYIYKAYAHKYDFAYQRARYGDRRCEIPYKDYIQNYVDGSAQQVEKHKNLFFAVKKYNLVVKNRIYPQYNYP